MLTPTQKMELIPLYAELAKVTRDECAECPGLCCHWYYCYLATRYAAEEWDIYIEVAPHPSGRSLAETGPCPIPPHLRPICTLHHCSLKWEGGMAPWRIRYDTLIQRIAAVQLGPDVRPEFLYDHFYKIEGKWALDEARQIRSSLLGVERS